VKGLEEVMSSSTAAASSSGGSAGSTMARRRQRVAGSSSAVKTSVGMASPDARGTAAMLSPRTAQSC